MKKLALIFSIGVSTLLLSCNDEKQESKDDNKKEETVVLEICDCITPSEENNQLCSEQFPEITDEDRMSCGDSSVVVIDTLSQVEKDSIRDDYENDLSLEIKEIEEEKEDPISEDCKMFLEDYAEAIKSYTALSEKVKNNPDDISLQIRISSETDELESWANKPQMFQCSQNEAFKKQVEILNEKRDKLLTM